MYDIKKIQLRLLELGFDPGPIDGVLGPRTEASIVAFKRSVGLAARSYLGPLTYQALFEPELKLETQDELPWIAWGRRLLGLHEVRDNDTLRKAMAQDSHALGDPSKLPWCGDFVETAIKVSLPNEIFSGNLAKNPYWALNWREFGVACKPVYGCVASVSRNGGGHVMFLVGEDRDRYYALGGNQSDTVSVAPMDKSRFSPESFRWPMTADKSLQRKLPTMASSAKSNTKES